MLLLFFLFFVIIVIVVVGVVVVDVLVLVVVAETHWLPSCSADQAAGYLACPSYLVAGVSQLEPTSHSEKFNLALLVEGRLR